MNIRIKKKNGETNELTTKKYNMPYQIHKNDSDQKWNIPAKGASPHLSVLKDFIRVL